jgi:PKD repeat protein
MTTENETKINFGLMARGLVNIAANKASDVADKALAPDFAKTAMAKIQTAQAMAKQTAQDIGHKAADKAIDTVANITYTATKDGNSTVKGSFEKAKQAVTGVKKTVTNVADKVTERVAEIDAKKNPKQKKWYRFGK